MRIICHLFFTTFILFEIQKSATGNEKDGNGAIIDTKFVELDGPDDSEAEEPINKKERSKGVRNFVGTNLFGDANGSRKNCFSSEDVALLAARRDFESLIPKTIPACLLDDELAKLLMQYFYEANQVIDKMTIGHLKTIAQRAYFDTLGGYLQYYMVPISLYSFYAGQIHLRTVEHILELYDQSKSFLNTNGNGWRNPLNNFSYLNIQVEPLRIIIDKIEDDTSCIELEMKNDLLLEEADMIIALPRLEVEDNGHLGNIWLPFKRKQTFNLRTSRSAFVLLRYFDLTTRCYNFQDICQDTFNRKFKNWIVENLEIHLKDEIFYPALGAILRILETLHTSGSSDFVVIQKRHKTQDYKTLASKANQLERHSKDWFKDIFGKSDSNNINWTLLQREADDEDEESRRMIYIYVTLVVVMLLLVFVISVAYIVKWSNTPATSSSLDPDLEKSQKKEKRVRISQELRRHSGNDDEELLIGPESSSIVSSPEITKSSKPTEDISSKNVKTPPPSSSCFPLCTRKNSLELETRPISSMESSSANDEMQIKEDTEQPTSSKFVERSKARKLDVSNDRKYVWIPKKKRMNPE